MDNWIIILITLVACSFFAGIEIAFLTANKLRIELENKQQYLPARILSFFVKNPSKFIATTLVGNNVGLVIYGIYMAQILEPLIAQYINSKAAIVIVQTIVSTLIVLVTAEFLPKALFRINPNRVLNLLAIPFIIVYYLFYPIVFLTIGLAEFLLKKVFRVHLESDKIAFGRIDLDNYVKQFTSSSGEHQQELDNEIKIFQNALDFSGVKIRDCMVPRNEIVALDVTSTMEELKSKFIETHLSRILIYEDSIDHIIGYTHSYELFKKPKNIRSVLLPVAIVPESKPAKDILNLLIDQRKSIAVVVDEFGGTSGMVTIEDVMEEIFGDIDDEHDKDELMEKKVSDSEYIFSGRLEVDYLNDAYKLNLPISDDYKTLAGLIIQYHQSIPERNEEIELDGFKLKVLTVSANKIDQVQLTIID